MNRPRFLLCYFEATRRCDQGCPYCMTAGAAPGRRAELSTDEAARLVLDEMKEICPGGAIALSGGEIMQREDYLELVSRNASNGLYTFVNTGGRLLDARSLRDLKKAAAGRLTMGFSLDSIDPEVHEKCRSGGPVEFERLARLCQQERVPFFVVVTVSKRNLSTLGATLDWLRGRGVSVIRSPFVPRGAAAAAAHLCLDRKDMERIAWPALCADPLCYVSFVPFFAAPDVMRLGLAGRGISLGNLGCQAGRSFIAVNAEGDVAPCVHLLDSPVLCGNVRQRPLSGIFDESPILAGLRGERPVRGKCARCRYGDSCRGCRSLAFYRSGDYLAEDPTCFFEPDGVEARSPHEEVQTRNALLFLNHIARNRPWKDIFGARGRLGIALLSLREGIRRLVGGLFW